MGHLVVLAFLLALTLHLPAMLRSLIDEMTFYMSNEFIGLLNSSQSKPSISSRERFMDPLSTMAESDKQLS